MIYREIKIGNFFIACYFFDKQDYIRSLINLFFEMLLGEWLHAIKPDEPIMKTKYIHHLKIYCIGGITSTYWRCDKCACHFSSYTKLRSHKRDIHSY